MNTIILNAETANLSIEQLLQQAKGGGVEVRDASGKVVAFVLSPADQEALTYVEANLDLNRNQQDVREALARRGGATTAELLEKADAASKKAAGQ